MRPSGADRAGQPRRARWFEVAAKNPMRGFCATRTQPRSFLFSDPGVGNTFDFSSRTVRNPGDAKTSARRRSHTGKRQEVHVAARMGSVQLLARTDRSMLSSNRGRRATNGRWSALQWGALKRINGVVMVGGFCVVSRITVPAAALFHHGARLRSLAEDCTIKAKDTAGALLDSVHTVDTGNGPALQTKKQPDLPQKVRFDGREPASGLRSVKIGGRSSTIDQEVTPGDERTPGPHQQLRDVGHLVGRTGAAGRTSGKHLLVKVSA